MRQSLVTEICFYPLYSHSWETGEICASTSTFCTVVSTPKPWPNCFIPRELVAMQGRRRPHLPHKYTSTQKQTGYLLLVSKSWISGSELLPCFSCLSSELVVIPSGGRNFHLQKFLNGFVGWLNMVSQEHITALT